MGTMCYFALHLVLASFIISKFRFPGWSTGEFWALIAVFQIVTYLSFFFYWRGISWTFNDIQSGTFDFVLSKPTSARVISFLRGGSTNNIIAVFSGLVMLSLVVIKFHLPVTIVSAVLFVFSIGVSLWLMNCIDVVFMSLNFRFGRLEETKGPVYLFQEAMKYPADLFTKTGVISQIIILPVSLLSSMPAAILLVRHVEGNLLLAYVFLALTLGAISEVMWKWGIRNYTGAS